MQHNVNYTQYAGILCNNFMYLNCQNMTVALLQLIQCRNYPWFIDFCHSFYKHCSVTCYICIAY